MNDNVNAGFIFLFVFWITFATLMLVITKENADEKEIEAAKEVTEEVTEDTTLNADCKVHTLTRERDEPPDYINACINANAPRDGKFRARDDIPLPPSLQEYTESVCKEFDIAPELIYAVMKTESGFDLYARSASGDVGIMQINEICAEYLRANIGTDDLADPEQNIRAGIFLFAGAYHRHGEDLHKAAMAYNFGDAGARELWGEGIYRTIHSERIQQYFTSFMLQNAT